MGAILVTYHRWDEPQRVDFHFFARELVDYGWPLTFVTARHGPRDYDGALPSRNGRLEASGGVEPYVLWRRRTRLPGRVSLALRRHYPGGVTATLAERIREAALVVIEPGEALEHVARIRLLNPGVRIVYRVTDPLHGKSAGYLESEAAAMPFIDAVSLTSPGMVDAYGHWPNVRLQPHGVDRSLFDRQSLSPYEPGSTNAVFAGMSGFDPEAIGRAVRLRPGITFHLIGPWEGQMEAAANVRFHGLLPFEETAPYIQHATFGLLPIRPLPGRTYYTMALKARQYTYCRLPVVAPGFLAPRPANFVAYTPGDDASIGAALDEAARADHGTIDNSAIADWEEVTRDLLRIVGLELGRPRGTAEPRP